MTFSTPCRQIFSIMIALWISASWAVAPVHANQVLCRIKMLKAATVTGPMVKLNDIAEVFASDSGLKDKLAHTVIVRSPGAGQIRWVMKEQVVRQLQSLGLQPNQWQLSSDGPTKVMLQRSTLEADKIRIAVERHIRQGAPWSPEQMKIREIKFKRDLQIPHGKVFLSVTTPKHSDWLGAVLFNVDVQVNGRLIQRVSVPANIEVWSDVIVAAKPLGKYQPINAQDIKVVQMNLARVASNAVLDDKQIIGQRAKRNIAVNSVLRSDQVELSPLVKRGDRVQAIATSSGLKISVQAVVKESGAKGEMVRVLNLRSKKVIHAQVVDAQTVSVSF